MGGAGEAVRPYRLPGIKYTRHGDENCSQGNTVNGTVITLSGDRAGGGEGTLILGALSKVHTCPGAVCTPEGNVTSRGTDTLAFK